MRSNDVYRRGIENPDRSSGTGGRSHRQDETLNRNAYNYVETQRDDHEVANHLDRYDGHVHVDDYDSFKELFPHMWGEGDGVEQMANSAMKDIQDSEEIIVGKIEDLKKEYDKILDNDKLKIAITFLKGLGLCRDDEIENIKNDERTEASYNAYIRFAEKHNETVESYDTDRNTILSGIKAHNIEVKSHKEYFEDLDSEFQAEEFDKSGVPPALGPLPTDLTAETIGKLWEKSPSYYNLSTLYPADGLSMADALEEG